MSQHKYKGPDILETNALGWESDEVMDFTIADIAGMSAMRFSCILLKEKRRTKRGWFRLGC